MLVDTCILLLLTALTNVFILVVCYKWGILDWFNRNRRSWMPAADCFFCLGFWLAVVEMAFAGPFLFDHLLWMWVPVGASVITSFITKILFS